MLKRCQSVIRGEKIYGQYWPKTSELFIACNYVVEHFPELTAYLDDPSLPSNNLSEKVLRSDRIMEDGRLHVEILMTIAHTGSAAEVEIKDYRLSVFKNRREIEADPKQFTPYVYALKLAAANVSK